MTPVSDWRFPPIESFAAAGRRPALLAKPGSPWRQSRTGAAAIERAIASTDGRTIFRQPRLHRIVVDIINHLLPFSLITHPTIKPFALPHRSRSAALPAHGFRAPSFDSFHGLSQRVHPIIARHQQRMPVIGHYREMRNLDTPFSQQIELQNHRSSGQRIAQYSSLPRTAVKVFLHRQKIRALHGRKSFRTRYDGLQVQMDFLQPAHHVIRKASGTTNGYEIPASPDFPMRQIAATEADRLVQSHSAGRNGVDCRPAQAWILLSRFRRSQTGATGQTRIPVAPVSDWRFPLTESFAAAGRSPALLGFSNPTSPTA